MESVSHPNGSDNLASNDDVSDSVIPDGPIKQEESSQSMIESYMTHEGAAALALERESVSSQMSESGMDSIDQSGGNQGPTSKLIVNYLPQTLTDDEFRGMFLSCGPVKASKICRDKESGFSYGFGFVEFVNVADAAKAIELLNGHVMGHKKLKVAYSRPPSRDMHEANLYMRGLPKSWSEDKLKDYCSKYGEIIQVRVLKDMVTGMSRGTGFVLFNRKTEADTCRTEMNGIILPECTEPLVIKVAEGPGGNEQKVRPPPGMMVPNPAAHPHAAAYQHTIPSAHVQTVRYFSDQLGVPPAPTSVGGPLRTGTSTPRMRYNPMMPSVKMHMAQQPKQPSMGPVLNYTTSGGSLLSARPPYPGHVSSTAEMIGLSTPILPVAGTVPRPVSRPQFPSYTTSRGSNPLSSMPAPFVPPPPPPPPPPSGAPRMLAAFDCPNDQMHSSNPMGAPPSATGVNTVSAPPGAGYQLFVYNCGTTADEKELYELFGPYGAITKVDVVRDPMNGNTKFAFVTMLNYEEAAAAVQALNGYCYTPRPLQVKFKSPNQQPGPAPGRN